MIDGLGRILVYLFFCLAVVPGAFASDAPYFPPHGLSIQLTPAETAFLERHPRIRLGTDSSWEPFVVKTATGETAGFDVDMIRLINALSGAEIELVTGKWDALVEAAKQREIDGLASSAALASRRPYFHFSRKYVSDLPLVILPSHQKMSLTSLEDLRGKRVGYQRGNAFLESILGALSGVDLLPVASETDAIKAMIEGRTDACMVGSTTYFPLHRQFSNTIKIGFVADGQPLDMVYSIRRDWPELVSIINKCLDALPFDVHARYYKKWFPMDPVTGPGRLSPEERAWLKNIGKPRVAVHINAPPFAFLNEAGLPQGIFVEYFEELQDWMGIPFELVPMERFAAAWEQTHRGKADLVMGMTSGQRHAQALNLSNVYYVAPIVLVTHSDYEFVSSLEDFHGRRVVVCKGHVSEQWIARDHPPIELIPVEDYEAGLRLVSQGKAHAFAGAMGGLTWQIRVHGIPDLKMAATTPYAYRLSIGIRKDWPEMVPIVNKALDAMEKERRVSIYEKWVRVHFKETVDWIFWGKTAGSVLAVSLVLCGLVMAWNRRLRREIVEREQVESALRESELRLEQISDTVEDVFWIVDWESRNYLYASRAFEAVWGLSRKRLYENAEIWSRSIHPQDGSHIHDLFVQLARGDAYDAEYQIIRPDGEIRWIHDRGYPVYDDTGRTVTVVGIAQDITARQEISDALEESEYKYQAVIEDLPGLICSFSPDLRISFVNRAYCRYFNRTYESLVGNRFLASIPKTQHAQVVTNIKSLSMDSPIMSHEHNVITAKGEIRWMRWTNRAIFDPRASNRIKGYQSVGEDITERKNAEKEILAQKRKAEQYLNLAGVIFVGIDIHGTVNLVNEKACEILEYNRSDIIGKNWLDTCIPPRKQAEVRSVFMELMEGHTSTVEYYENPILTRTGKERLITWHNTHIREEDHSIVGVLGAGEDVTEKRRLEQRLHHMQKMESIGNLAGGIAHDFNNILSSIIGYTELALDDVKKGSLMEDNLQEVFSAGKRAKGLVKQILAIARQSEEETKPMQPGIIVKEVAKFLRSSIPSTIEIVTRIESASYVMGNSTQIHQICMNLCTNGAQAMEKTEGVLSMEMVDMDIEKGGYPGEGDIYLKPGRYVCIQVSDTGAGIPPENLDSIFEPYFTTKPPGEGTGMGLAVVQGIVESYGGKITVDSRYGQGSTFSVYLPVTHQGNSSRTYVPEDLPHGTEGILFVDDEVAIGKIAKRILEQLGYRVTVETNSTTALERFAAAPDRFDLLITDMTMPGMAGDVLATEVMAIRPELPVILCTGYSKRMTKDLAVQLGVKGLAYKPIMSAELARMVRRALDGESDLWPPGEEPVA